VTPSGNFLAKAFEAAYQDYHVHFHRVQDPVHIPHLYQDPRDKETVAFFAALLAYGNVKTIIASVQRLLLPLGDHPHEFLLSRSDFTGVWKGFRHRFTTEEDLEILSSWMHHALKERGSLESFFFATTLEEGSPLKDLMSDFVQRMRVLPLPKGYEEKVRRRERNLKYLLSDPLQGSACKRLNMFLRWVARPSDGIDLGLWKKLTPDRLMLPVDTHLLQTLQRLRWTKSKSANWRVVEEATLRLRKLLPEDPIRYDFALCHLSMSGKNIGNYKKRARHAPME
jgi:uncharacterized protein (TIGR02757 family)